MTYSIVARCPSTGQYGVAVATYSPMVGNVVPLVIGGRGAVAYQAVASPAHRALAAQLLANGTSANAPKSGSLPSLARDSRGEQRQHDDPGRAGA